MRQAPATNYTRGEKVMANLTEKIDLYDDNGKLLESAVPLEAITPWRNEAIQEIVDIFKRSIGVNLAGAEKSLKTGHYGGEYSHLPGRTVDIDLVKNSDKIAKRMADMLSIDAGDAQITSLKDGAYLVVRPPLKLAEVGIEYTTSLTCTSMAAVDAVLQEFDLGWKEAPLVKAAFMGRYPQSVEYMGGNVITLLAMPVANEGPGFALRNIMVNHLVAITKKRTMQSSALCSILENTAHVEMGDSMGRWRRWQMLILAYQGLNADNLLHDLVKANGTGTTGEVIASVVERAIKDNVIKVGRTLASGYNIYEAVDADKWNAYCATGLLAATIVNQGSARAAQGVSSTMLYYNDLIEHETGLPSTGYGDGVGNGISFSFFSHSIYGGGSPGVFSGNHIVTRHSKGFGIPNVAAAVSLDNGTAVYGPEATSGLVGEIFGGYKVLSNSISAVAAAAGKIKNDF